MTKPCPVCGRDHKEILDPDAICTPALRSLVRACGRISRCWEKNDFSDEWDNAHAALRIAWRKFNEERAR